MTWLLVRTSPVDVITMPVPAAPPPPLRVTLMLTIPGVTLAATPEVSAGALVGGVTVLPSLLVGAGGMTAVFWFDVAGGAVKRATATPEPMPTTKRLTRPAASRRRLRGLRCGAGCHEVSPANPQGIDGGGGGGGGPAGAGAASEEGVEVGSGLVFCTSVILRAAPCNNLTSCCEVAGRGGGTYEAPTRTSILPVLSPRSSPMNASGAFSMPSTMVSRATMLPLATHGATSLRKSAKRAWWSRMMKPRRVSRLVTTSAMLCGPGVGEVALYCEMAPHSAARPCVLSEPMAASRWSPPTLSK